MSKSKRTLNQIEVKQRAVSQARTSHHPHIQRNATKKVHFVNFAFKTKEIPRIKARQQRLLMLKYAAECSMTNCGSTCARMHCRKMNKLWAHMRGCSDAACARKHCYSSRSILTHYHRCVDKCCLVCAPLRLLRSVETECMPVLLSKATPICSSTTIQTHIFKRIATTRRRVSLRLSYDLEATNITPV